MPSNIGSIPNFGGSKNKMKFISILHSFLDKLACARFRGNSLYKKNECKILMYLFFYTPRLGTEPMLDVMTVHVLHIDLFSVSIPSKQI